MITALFRIKAARLTLGLGLTFGLLGGGWFLAYDFFKPKAAAEQKEKPAVKKEATVDLQIERTIRESMQENMALEPQTAQRIVTAARQAMDTFTARGLLPVFLASPDVRRHLRQLLSHYLRQIVVLSHREITGGVKIQSLGVIR